MNDKDHRGTDCPVCNTKICLLVVEQEKKANTEGANGGIYEPVRKAICGPGPCEGKDLETYRYALAAIKQVEDNVAATCFNMGVEHENKRLSNIIESVRGQFNENDDFAVLAAIDFILKAINAKGETKTNAEGA